MHAMRRALTSSINDEGRRRARGEGRDGEGSGHRGVPWPANSGVSVPSVGEAVGLTWVLDHYL